MKKIRSLQFLTSFLMAFILIAVSISCTYDDHSFFSIKDVMKQIEQDELDKLQALKEIEKKEKEELLSSTNDPEHIIETFSFNYETPRLDILIVIDSSRSMNYHLEKLAKSLSHLLLVIKDYDWQIAFIQADHGDHDIGASHQDQWQDYLFKKDDIKLISENPGFGSIMPLEENGQLSSHRILNNSFDNYEDIFYDTVSVYKDGDYNNKDCNLPPFCQQGSVEQPLRALKSAIERSEFDNKDFFREDSNLLSIIISNEDERKEDPERATNAEDVIIAFNKHIKAKNRYARFFAFNFIVTSEKCLMKERDLDRTFSSVFGKRISKLANLTNGENVDICNLDNESKDLKNISKKVARYFNYSVNLKKKPLDGEIEVDFLNGKRIVWTLQNRKLTFSEGIVQSSKVRISYKAD